MPSLFTGQYGVTGLLVLDGCWVRCWASINRRLVTRFTSPVAALDFEVLDNFASYGIDHGEVSEEHWMLLSSVPSFLF